MTCTLLAFALALLVASLALAEQLGR